MLLLVEVFKSENVPEGEDGEIVGAVENWTAGIFLETELRLLFTTAGLLGCVSKMKKIYDVINM